MSKADAVENHGQKLFAATENLLMPMVQFGFLFPVVLAAIFSTVCFIISYSPLKSYVVNGPRKSVTPMMMPHPFLSASRLMRTFLKSHNFFIT